MRGRTAESVLTVVMAAPVVSTALHYADNAVRLDQYPAPGWVDVPVIAGVWVGLTAVGLLGYRLFRRGAVALAAVCLAVYSATGLSSLGHFRYETGGYDALQLVLISTDGLTGLAVFAFAAWAATRPRTLRGIG